MYVKRLERILSGDISRDPPPTPRRKIVKKVVKKVSKKPVAKSVGNKVAKSLATSLSKVSISTRTSARLHKPSPTLEKSKKLLKKAVIKSKQVRDKISPKVLRALRPRKVIEQKKVGSKQDTTESTKVEEEGNKTANEEKEADESDLTKADDAKPAENSPEQEVFRTRSTRKLAKDTSKEESNDGADQTVLKSDSPSNDNAGEQEAEKCASDKEDDQDDEANNDEPIEEVQTKECTAQDIGEESTTPVKQSATSLDETINSLAANRSKLFDTLFSEPPRKSTRSTRLTKIVSEPDEEPEPDVGSSAVPAPVTVPVFVPEPESPPPVETVQPMFSDDEDDSTPGMILSTAVPVNCVRSRMNGRGGEWDNISMLHLLFLIVKLIKDHRLECLKKL